MRIFNFKRMLGLLAVGGAIAYAKKRHGGSLRDLVSSVLGDKRTSDQGTASDRVQSGAGATTRGTSSGMSSGLGESTGGYAGGGGFADIGGSGFNKPR